MRLHPYFPLVTETAAPFVKREVSPASASLALFSALPTSLQSLAIASPSAAASVISSEIIAGGGTTFPAWWYSLPGDIQTYFLTADAAAATATTSSRSISTTTRPISSTYSGTTGQATTEGSSAAAASATTSPSKGSKHGIGGGAIAGIVIGILSAAAILCALLYFFRRRGKMAQTLLPVEADEKRDPHHAPEVVPPEYMASQAIYQNGSGAVELPLTPSAVIPSARAEPPGTDSHRAEFSHMNRNEIPGMNRAELSDPNRATEVQDAQIMRSELPDGRSHASSFAVPRRQLSAAEKEVVPSSAPGQFSDGRPSLSPAASSSATTSDSELSLLREERARLLEKRKRLVELQSIDEQEEQVRRRIDELESSRR